MLQALLFMWGVIAWLFLFLHWYVPPIWLMLLTTILAVGVFIWEYNGYIRRQSSKRSGRDTVALSAALLLFDGLLAAWAYHAWALDWFSPFLVAKAVLGLTTALTLYGVFRYRRYMNQHNVTRQSGRKREGYFKSNKMAQRTPQQRRRQKETEQDGLASLVLGSEAKDE